MNALGWKSSGSGKKLCKIGQDMYGLSGLGSVSKCKGERTGKTVLYSTIWSIKLLHLCVTAILATIDETLHYGIIAVLFDTIDNYADCPESRSF
ncbi:unnamed protein product [Sphenostylis stenocarpa]|uniref:Uncharacterized protein n=1 Tax=Sphenostylis stenocarpa TaxID=92480 RepID=A0AA86VX12_9FABA|nr:unnamed protein product [Sphenostylis stenocarpa]